ncbi:diguanylate cyclase/phosphodiesterase [Balnearium lithotrophicum]|uniref:Diguanylate cyclase/phosphodiesterase n=1 Tax=Balnearium lithotrophicum TaxID=223788 RepID=A0A521DA25_9BACT|nr:bifunctional diguanylate cyclase/phosphodiesterase [Balnearium lithotrophicum]SMO67941.1 diguanylate cyclase/phosphodiesterase [Balnearium lithotrophicum]
MNIIKIAYPLENELEKMKFSLLQVLAFLIIIPLVFGTVISESIRRLILNYVVRIQKIIQKNQSLEETICDLEQFLLTEKSGFEEIEKLRKSLYLLLDKIEKLSVDKTTLEKQIKVLNKLIITSDILKDWKEPVEKIFKVVSDVVDVKLGFLIFDFRNKDNENRYYVYIFWFCKPDDKFLVATEEIIKELIGTESIKIKHKFIKDETKENKCSFLEPSQEEIKNHLKYLIFPESKVGGILGVGFLPSKSSSESQKLTLESLLPTLLSAAGSIKAINKYTKEIEYFATRDPLTHLYNQRVFWELLEYEINRASRRGYKFTLLVVDLDNFKFVNDTYGHKFGDEFLRNFAKLLKKTIRKEDIVARFGGDEFCVIMPETDKEEALIVAKRILEEAENKSILAPDGKTIMATVSIGGAVFPDHGKTAKDLFNVADNMMYKAKREGKDRIRFPSDEDLNMLFKEQEKVAILITKAIRNRDIIPFYQPIKSLKSDSIDAYEVLMRIKDENGKPISAYKFIEFAEQLGSIYKMELILFENFTKYVTSCQFNGKIFFNFSPKSITNPDYLNSIKSIASNYHLSPENIVFEITERETLKNLDILKYFVEDLKDLGFNFAIDDFGSGYSSYLYLKYLPIDFVKIEGDFVKDMVRSRLDFAVVNSISVLCKDLGIETVAEFVESEEIYELCKKLGIDFVQGYFIGKPSEKLQNCN